MYQDHQGCRQQETEIEHVYKEKIYHLPEPERIRQQWEDVHEHLEHYILRARVFLSVLEVTPRVIT